MKKLPLMLGLLAFTTSGATFADDIDWFVGGTLGYQKNGTDNAGGYDDDDGVYGVQGGAYLGENHNHRVSLGYSFNESDTPIGHVKLESIIASYDYMVPFTSNGKWSWFVGPSIASSKVDDNTGSDSAFSWGGQTGVNWQITEHINTDLGYRYMSHDFDSDDSVIDDSQQVYMTLNFRF
ncbi:outer membrane beta-barrel protein [Motilimonas pumila]|uniref:Porin family protein n=1 Tax=Motilimonas pumila TaxID=2303987 RepID=A0A418YII5_9GAMM|nr:outer membrane beta-barrel protein [Motilimonas pumila]RJG50461.1 porin family protein [Motilimonas pumila]